MSTRPLCVLYTYIYNYTYIILSYKYYIILPLYGLYDIIVSVPLTQYYVQVSQRSFLHFVVVCRDRPCVISTSWMRSLRLSGCDAEIGKHWSVEIGFGPPFVEVRRSLCDHSLW